MMRESPVNDAARTRAVHKLSSVLGSVLRKGYHGEVTLRVKVQDGVAQTVDVSTIEVERF